jgi:hypothetical protein
VLLPLMGALLVLQAGSAVASDATFSGTLERVGSNSLSIKLSDRRIVDAMFPNSPTLDVSTIATQYLMGDQLEIACHTILPICEEGTSRYQSLEVTKIRLVRRPSPEELLRLLGGVPFREGKNMLQHPETPPPPPSPSAGAPGGAELERARPVNLEYADNMPNFVADEKAKRYRRGPGSTTWRDFDAVESEITFQGNHAARRAIRRDGAPWPKPFEALPGFKWYEGFGTEVKPLFDPKCPTTIEYHGHAKAAGRPAVEYVFRAPADGCFPFSFSITNATTPQGRDAHWLMNPTGGCCNWRSRRLASPPKSNSRIAKNTSPGTTWTSRERRGYCPSAPVSWCAITTARDTGLK